MEDLKRRLDVCLDRVTGLPPAPVIVPRLLHLLGQAEVDSGQVGEVIACDPALTAAVLRLCNSALLAHANAVANLPEAVLRVGFAPVYEFVVAILGARAMVPAQKGYGIDEGELWKHCVATGLAARCMARARGSDESLAFTAGILHDIGKLVLAQSLEESYRRLMAEIAERQASLLESEASILGVQHAEIGGRLLERWHFPEALVMAVWHHHNPAGASGHEPLAAVVYLGNLVAHFMGFGYGHQALALRGRAEALELAGITAQELPHFMIETYDLFKEMERLVGTKG